MRQGWQVLDLSLAPILEVIDVLQAGLGCFFNDYHCEENAAHWETQVRLATCFIEGGWAKKIIRANLRQFQTLLGMDLHIQKYPYFRIARPGKREDNIGIHRDTKYGGSPYEVSVVIPLNKMPPDGCIRVLDGSNVVSEETYPYRQVYCDVERGSDRHKLGFLYAPKRLMPEIPEQTHPVMMDIGQALVFPLSLVHGQEINHAQHARFSVDIRLVNSLAPIRWSKTVHEDFYEPLCISPITEQAKLYEDANGANH